MDTFEKIIIPLISIIVSIVVAYFTAVQAYKKQFDEGKILLLEIIKRYVINVKNNFDLNGQIKTEDIDKQYYLTELKSINDDLKALFSNPLLIKALKKHSGLTLLTVSLRREIVFLSQSKLKPAIYGETVKAFISLFDTLKPEFSKKLFETDNNLKEINEIINFLRKIY